ncbi:MAG: RNA polymerase sigma-I factor [Clostridium sp.]|nr:RNA polymerase sigma-I factor [Clostridium sp.]
MDRHSQSANPKKENTKRIIKESLERISLGDNEVREEFIRRFRPFILKLVYKVIDKYVEPENTEEYSVALLAFNEAIDTYDEGRHPNFLVFSEMVIRRRLIDHKRKNNRHSRVLPFSCFEPDDQKLQRAFPESNDSGGSGRLEFLEDMSYFKNELNTFNITLKELVSCTPKHRDSRESLIKIARILAKDDELYTTLRKKRKIPVVGLLKRVSVSRRTIERNRKYIIAVSLILRSNLEIFREYADCYEERGTDLR